MAETLSSEPLNRLLIDLGRCFLQYVGDCWPWTQAGGDEARQTIDRLVGRQREGVARLTELLVQRNGSIDFGSFPTAYTDLHYVALDYLLGQLIDSEEALVQEVEETLEEVRDDDPQAAGVLEELLAEERDTLAELRKLADSRTSAS